ncbi:hypothetical protein ES703_37252 [subsurface metagenome]
MLRIQAVIAPPTPKSPVVMGLPFLSEATVILSILSRMSAKSRTMESIAISSLLTAMPNLDCMVKPSMRPPRPMTMLRKLWAQKSIIQPISTRVGSMFRRRILVSLSSCSSS